MRRKGLRFYPAILLFLGIVGVIGFILWTTNTHPAMPEALESLISDSDVLVQTDPWLVFRPEGGNPSTGLILYPGGLVDPADVALGGPCAEKIIQSLELGEGRFDGSVDLIGVSTVNSY